MKYVCMPEPGKVEIREGEMPKEREGHAILKLLYGGICGSDLGTYRGTFPYVSYPRIPGHEFSAEIVQVGANSFGLKEGMIVTCNPYFNCGECYSCRRGYVNCCTSNETMGVQRDGAFCEYISMPVERIYDGKGLPAKTLAAIEPFCISYHAAKRAKIQPGERVLVVGGGTIGYLAAAAAKAMGAEVTLSDIAPDKLAFAEKTGVAAHTILNSSEEAFSEAAAELTGGDGFDVCMEAVGCPDTFMSCINAAAFRGRVVDIGVGKDNLDFFYTVIQKKELDIYGSRNAEKSDFLELIDLVREGRADLDAVISKVYDFEDAAQAWKDFSENQGTLMKVMLKF